MNVLKIFFFTFFRNEIVTFAQIHSDPIYFEIEYSKITLLFLAAYDFLFVYAAAFVMTTQLLTSSRTIKLINQMNAVQKMFKTKFDQLEEINEENVKRFRGKISMFWFATLLIFVLEFSFAMKKSALSLLSYFVSITPLLISASYISYIYTVLQTFINANQSLVSYAKSSPTSEIKVKIDNISCLRQAFFELKERFAALLSSSLFVIMCFYIFEIVLQVSLKKISENSGLTSK